nr:LUD domain-containing protein [Zoogloea sp.]
MSARDRILAKLRGARPAEPLAHPDPAPHYAARARNESKAERLARFRTGIEGFHADVHVTTEADWPALLARLCADKGVGTLLSGRNPAGRRLDPATFAGTTLRPWAGRVEDIKADLFHTVDAGFTQTRGAIAETGSLILWSSADEPRTPVPGAADPLRPAGRGPHPPHLLRRPGERELGGRAAHQRPADLRPVQDRRHPADPGLWRPRAEGADRAGHQRRRRRAMSAQANTAGKDAGQPIAFVPPRPCGAHA